MLTGCAGFFVDPSTTTTGTGGSTPSTTGDYVYAVNNGNTLSGFTVGTSSLTSLFNPLALPTPLASGASVAISRDNSQLFVGGAGGLVTYGVSSSGQLSVVTNGAITELANFVSMATSPDGQWLLALDSVSNVIYVFSINYSTQVLSLNNQYPIQIGGAQILSSTAPARALAISPDGSEVAVAVGTAGDEVFSFTTSTGVLTAQSTVNAPASPYSDFSVTFDGTYSASAGTATASSHLFIGRGLTGTGTSQIVTYAVSGGILSGSPAETASGQQPYQLLIDPTGTYLYSANRDNTASTGGATISGYTVAGTGALTQLANSPFTSGLLVTGLAEDNAKTHLIAASAGGTPDLTLYTFNTATGDGGQLVQTATAANGSSTGGSIAVATTH